MESLPVTAVMLTKPSHEGMAVRAINDFLAQLNVPERTLLVYTDDATYGYELQKRFLSAGHRVVVTTYQRGLPLRDVLQASIGVAKTLGDYYVLWDDDNRYHPSRLERQLHNAEQTQGGRPSFLTGGVWHFFDTGELFVLQRDKRHENLRSRVIASTMLVHTRLLSASLVPVDRGGSPTSAFGQVVLMKYDTAPRPPGEWWWTVVGVRGDNASGYEWHRGRLSDRSRCMSRAWLGDNEVVVRHWLEQYEWDDPGLDVCGHDGMAFKFNPTRFTADDLPPIGDPEGVERVYEKISEGNENA